MDARSGTSDPTGKCTADVKVHLPEATRDALAAIAVINGVPLGEYIREVLQQHVYGHLALMRMRARGDRGEGEE